MTYTWDKANADAPSTRRTHYFEMFDFEMFGNRAIYHDGWYSCATPPAPTLVDGAGEDTGCGQRL
jgi:arylsulfatase